MFCPNCMSPYVQPFRPPADAEPADAEPADAEPADDGAADDGAAPVEAPPKNDEPLIECTECEWVGPITEFVPENYR
ncbi:MAG: hypothetical protein WAP35_04240 [Solirubrobacterales bacterium]